MYTRKTKDVYKIMGNCGYGWDIETQEETMQEAREQKKCYENNVNYPIKIIKKREKLEV